MPSSEQCDASATWIVVPAYNEEPLIAGVLADLQSLMHHVVVVDDGSGDATADVAMAAGGRVVVLKHPINLGQGAALQTGITFALSRGAEFIAAFDADAQHCACDVERLLEAVAMHKADYYGARLGNPNPDRAKKPPALFCVLSSASKRRYLSNAER